jgi:hypothetical protein
VIVLQAAGRARAHTRSAPGGYARMPYNPQWPKTENPETRGNKGLSGAGDRCGAGRMSGPALTRLKYTEMARKQREENSR